MKKRNEEKLFDGKLETLYDLPKDKTVKKSYRQPYESMGYRFHYNIDE